MAKKKTDLVDAGSEYSFPASDPPSYMGGTAVAGPPPEDEPTHGQVMREPGADERIRKRAHEIWESESRSGDAQDHWLRAEREMRGASSEDRNEATEAGSQPPSQEAEKMAEQVKVAMDARNARSKQTKRAGTGGKKDAAKTGSSSKGEPRRPK